MKPTPQFSSKRGWALISVVMFSAILLMIAGSLISYSTTERRMNEQHRLQLKSRNMAENIANYASEQLTLKLKRIRNASPRIFAGGVNQIYLPPDSLLNSATSSAADMEVWAGLTSQTGFQFIDPIANPTNPYAGLQVNTATVPILAKAYFKNDGARISATAYASYDLNLALVPIFQFGLFYNMDLEITPGGDMTIAGPVHTNGRLAARSQHQFSNTIRFTERVSAVEGVYANANMKVTNRTGNGVISSGTPGDANGGNGPILYTHPNGTETNMYGSNIWRDHKWGTSTETATTQNSFKTFATSTYGANLRTYLHNISKLSLPGIGDYSEVDNPGTTGDERENGRQIIDPPLSTDSVDLKYEKVSYRSGLYIVVNPDDVARTARLPDGTTITMAGHSYRCWLNTFNSDATNTLTEVVLPGQPSYGADNSTQNNLPNRFTDGTYVGTNQILRIPSSGRVSDALITSVPDIGNAVRDTTIKTGYPTGLASPGPYPAVSNAYFYDLRRATGNNGFPFNRGTTSGTTTYTPRPIAKIDFDLTRFKMALERTLYRTGLNPVCDHVRPVYDVSSSPVSYTATFDLMKRSVGTTIHGVWKRHIFNPSADPTSSTSTISLQLDTSPTLLGGLNKTGAAETAAKDPTKSDPFRILFTTGTPVTASDLVSNSIPSPWFDGIAIYLHSVEAEKRTSAVIDATGRVDSGVRLINARGRAPTLDSATYPAKTGFTFATNDALYVLGHFNAHGKNLVTDHTSSSYSARYPSDNSEPLCSLMADAITILTQPIFEGPLNDTATVAAGSVGTHGYPVFSQKRGWADALSHLRTVTANNISSNQIANWRTTDPSPTNNYDGLGSGTDRARTGVLPTLQDETVTSPTSLAPQFTQKQFPTDTEISAALLVGIVPSNHNPTGLITPAPSTTANGASSGGAHNFPRLLENWSQSATRTATQIQDRTNAGNNGTASNLIIRGSMVAAFESRVAVEPWSIRYYSAPSRHWGLHEGFRQINHDVPLEPILLNTTRMSYRELTQAQYNARKAIIQALPAP